jgi:guanosine-3',5'-bis(diphosphate) 3'-pyrophosphohydrolase
LNRNARLLRALAFAAEKHKDHRRKDVKASPYINHLIAAALVLAEEGRVADEDLIVAAILHDTVEDTETSFAELAEHFGETVTGIVREVTDDKTLKKEARKRLQEENSSKASPQAKQLKIADKICNVRDIMHHPPSGWALERKEEYVAWARRVVAGCRGVNEYLDKACDETLDDAARHLKLPRG